MTKITLDRNTVAALVELLSEIHPHVAFDRVLMDRVDTAADELETLLNKTRRE
jgi:hypothetical protein